jgi:hypothetical protein
MKNRTHRIVKYADDILILCRTEKAAHSGKGVKFLGVEIGSQWIRIQASKLIGFQQKVKQLTKRNGGINLVEVIKRLNPVVRGFVNYFSIANCKRALKALAGWLRRRLRAIQLRLWKKPPFKFIKMNSWRNSLSPLSSVAMPNQWFEVIGLYLIEDVNTGWLALSAFRK